MKKIINYFMRFIGLFIFIIVFANTFLSAIYQYNWWALLIIPTIIIASVVFISVMAIAVLYGKYFVLTNHFKGFFKWLGQREKERSDSETISD